MGSRFMLAKTERLTRAEFNHFFSAGKRYHHPYFTLVYYPSSAFHGSVVVPKKVLKGAVKRNTLRRRTYDILRSYARSKGRTGVYILLMKPPSAVASYADLKEALLARIDAVR